MKTNRKHTKELNMLSVYWGFSLGGGVRYAYMLNDIVKYFSVNIKHLCIRSKAWKSDVDTLSKINAENIFIGSRFDFCWVRKLADVIRTYHPDVIMTHGFNGHFAVLIASFWAGYSDIPKICSYHGRYHPPIRSRFFLSGAINGFTEYFIRNKVISAVTVSEFSKNNLVSKGVDPQKISVVYNGLEVSRSTSPFPRHRLRKDWNVGDDDFLLGTISRLDAIKGIEFLLEALDRLGDIARDVKLVIIGTGPLEIRLKNYVYRHGLGESVFFAGNRSDIDDCLQAIDVFVLPSLEENHSIALLEAMRSGKTIIASDVGGNGESVRDGVEALLVPSENAEALASSIITLYKNKSLCAKLGKNAYKRFLSMFTIEKTLTNTCKWIVASINE